MEDYRSISWDVLEPVQDTFSAGTATESEETQHAASPGLVDNVFLLQHREVRDNNTSMISV